MNGDAARAMARPMQVRAIPESNKIVRLAALSAGVSVALILLAVSGIPDSLVTLVSAVALVLLGFAGAVAAVFIGWNTFATTVVPFCRWTSDGENWIALGRFTVHHARHLARFLLSFPTLLVLGAIGIAALWAAGSALNGLSTHTLLVLIVILLLFR